ncbi:MAG: hypothetical protein N3B68_04410 [Anaerolineae bacterium]|nr:hypothetical protein [Anaerolineae bacterium]
MKQYIFASAAVLVALLAAVVLLQWSASAASSPSVILPSSLGPEGISSPPTDYLLLLPIIPPDPAEVLPGLTPEEANEFARHLTYRQAESLLAELEHLRAEGFIAGYEIRADLHGVVVKRVAEVAQERLFRLSGVAGGLAFTGEVPPCAAATGKALRELVLSFSQGPAFSSLDLRTAGISPQSSAPSVHIRLPPGAESTYIEGYTSPTTTVTLRIFRRGRLIATQSTSSTASGWYYFYPQWSPCFPSSWSLRPGDVVEVTARGQTARTVVADLWAWVDPFANIVVGRTEPGRSVQVALIHYETKPCSGSTVTVTAETDPTGYFTATFPVDFNGSAWTRIYARDRNGNSTYYFFYAYRITAGLNSQTISGFLKPGVNFIAALVRSGNTVSVYSATSRPDGDFIAWFTDTLRPGDVVTVSGGGVSLQFTLAALSVTVDHVADRITGTTGPDRLVVANSADYGYHRCAWAFACQHTYADMSGNFAISAGMDLRRLNTVDLRIYDRDGNIQYAYFSIPGVRIYLYPYSAYLQGFWRDPSAGQVTVTVKDSTGTMRKVTSATISTAFGSFFVDLMTAISPTDRIEITDGAFTETLEVPDLTARLDGDTGRLTGTAGPGRLIALLYDFRREQNVGVMHCAEAEVTSAGAYTLTFSEAQIGGRDYAEVRNINPDGHIYQGKIAHAFTVWAGERQVDGYTETPYATVTITLWRNNDPSVVVTTTSWSSGHYWQYLDAGIVLTQGDKLEVETSDGDRVVLDFPLTVQMDRSNQRIYGTAPADEPVRVQARRHGRHWWDYVHRVTVADSFGNYTTSFSGLYWEDCSPVDLRHRCIQPAVYYDSPAGHQVWIVGPVPQPIGMDPYEDDDVPARAHAYTGICSHTFHTVTDTDWVSFTVSQADVDKGVFYRIETFNMGRQMTTRVILYDAQMNTVGIWEATEYRGRGVQALWWPSEAGVYYLQVKPPEYWQYTFSDTYCDAVYSLMILPVRGQVYLPLVMRDP